MALDRIILSLNVNGKPGEYYDERDWGLPFEKIWSDNMCRIFCPVQVPREWLPKIKEWMQPVGMSKILDSIGQPIKDPISFRDRAVVCDLAEVGKAVDIPDLQEKVQSQVEKVDLINGTELSMDLFKDAMLFDPSGKIVDLNTISSGSWTVGAAQQYATWYALGADIVGTTLTGNLTGTQQTAITETVGAFARNYILGGFTLLLTSSVNPKGNFGAGWLISFNHALSGFGVITTSGAAGTIAMSNLNMKRVAAVGSSVCEIYFGTAFSAGTLVNINDCLVNRNNYAGSNSFGIFMQCASVPLYKIFNTVIANVPGGALTGGLFSMGCDANSVFENMTIVGCAKGLHANYIASKKINIACFNTVDYYFVTEGTFTKCASSDTTGSEPALRSLVAANEFRSTTLAAGDPFMRVKLGGQLANGGVAPSIAANTYGNRGNTRGRGSPASYSIGADEINNGPALFQMLRSK